MIPGLVRSLPSVKTDPEQEACESGVQSASKDWSDAAERTGSFGDPIDQAGRRRRDSRAGRMPGRIVSV